MRQVKPNVSVIGQFSVVSTLDGYTKVSGQTVFTSTVWKDAVVQAVGVIIVEIGSSGEYKFEFTPDDIGYWKVEILIDYNKELLNFEYSVSEILLEDIYEIVRRTAGLSHENIFIDNTLYDADGQLIEARVRVFDTKANCETATDGGAETIGMLGSYTLQSIWDVVNQFKTFRQVLDT